MSDQTNDRRQQIEDKLTKPMFGLSLLFLVFTAAAIYLGRDSNGATANWPGERIAIAGLLLLWPAFVTEAVVRYYLAPPVRRSWKDLLRCLTTGLLPPLRLAAHGRARPGCVWLPWMGWRRIHFDLQKDLERGFSGPMFLMALLILPVLAVEYFWADAVSAYSLLRAGLTIGVGVIWIAFTIEFVIRISVSEKKVAYAFNHWVDLAVVLLPMVEFMPFLRVFRVTRLMRLERLARIAKYYRLYGVAGKGWRGVVALRLIQRLMSRSPGARISRLKAALEDKQEEMGELEREVDYYRRRIEAATQERVADDRPRSKT